MIDAVTARQITSEAALTKENVLDDIFNNIKQQAYLGSSTLRYFCNRCSWRNDDKDATTYNLPFVNVLIEELVKLGYDAFLSKGEVYKSGDTEHYNVFLFIRWK